MAPSETHQRGSINIKEASLKTWSVLTFDQGFKPPGLNHGLNRPKLNEFMPLAGLNSILPGLNRLKPPAGINQVKPLADINSISAGFFQSLDLTRPV